MSDRPIIFSDAMVRAILDGSKTQTRRILKPQPWQFSEDRETWMWRNRFGYEFPLTEHAACVEMGSQLWVREAWSVWLAADLPCINYRASCGTGKDGLPEIHPITPEQYFRYERKTKKAPMWRSPIHMPRWASRITLTVTNVHVQRVQEISEADAWAEGVQAIGCTRWESEGRHRFAGLWEEIHGEGAWDANPWVSAITFTAEARNIDAEMQAP